MAEKNIKVDEEGFYKAQEKAKESSKKLASEFDKEKVITIQKLEGLFGSTNFVGYEELSTKAKIIALLNKDFKEVNSLDKEGYAVFDKTPFYAESGGQIGDTGEIAVYAEGEPEVTFAVADTHKVLILDADTLQDGFAFFGLENLLSTMYPARAQAFGMSSIEEVAHHEGAVFFPCPGCSSVG